MDSRTTQVLRSLDPVSADILAALCGQSLPEKRLVEQLPDIPQPTLHKKLGRLAEADLIKRPAGSRGQPWEVRAAGETKALLDALLALSDRLDELGRSERSLMRKQLRGGAAQHLRSVK